MNNIQKEDHNHSKVQDVYRVDLNLPVGEQKILKAEGDYDRGLLVKLLKDGGYEVAYWLEKPEVYPIEILIDGKSVAKDAKTVSFRFHPELEKAWITNPRGSLDTKNKKIQKENGGGGNGGGNGGGGATGGFGGTVAVSTDSGFFTPTYGGGSGRKLNRAKRKKKKKKRTGIHRLADFVNNFSPQRKMIKKSTDFTLDLVDWVRSELQKDDIKFRQQTSSEDINPQTKLVNNEKNPVEFDSEPDKQAAVEQKDMEQKIRNLDDSDDIKDNNPDEKGDAGQTSPAGLNVQLQYGSGPERGSLVTGGSKDKKSGIVEELEESTEDIPFEKVIGKDLYKKLLGD